VYYLYQSLHIWGGFSPQIKDLCILRDKCGFNEENLHYYKELFGEGTGDLDCTAAAVDVAAASGNGCCAAP